jgi:hypothetical protein
MEPVIVTADRARSLSDKGTHGSQGARQPEIEVLRIR